MIMTYDQWLKEIKKKNAELGVTITLMGKDPKEVEGWKKKGKVPQFAIDFLESL